MWTDSERIDGRNTLTGQWIVTPYFLGDAGTQILPRDRRIYAGEPHRVLRNDGRRLKVRRHGEGVTALRGTCYTLPIRNQQPRGLTKERSWLADFDL